MVDTMTNKRHIWILTLLLTLSVALAGCNVAMGNGDTQEESMKPLDPAAWPTAVPTALLATPTPFPRITLQPTATPTPRPDPAASPAEADPTAVAAEGISYDGNVEDLKAEVTTLTGGFEPVAAGFVTAEGVQARQGPGSSYPAIGPAEQGELGAVLGVDASRSWLYMITISGTQGWLPADSVRVTGSLEDAPVLPDNPVASQPAAAASSDSQSNNPVTGKSVTSTDLEPVITAVVNSETLNLRQGPGAAYGQLATLGANERVSLLALNKTRDWALVETATDQLGWVSLPYLNLEGSLDDVPSVISAGPDTDLAPGEIAPMQGFTTPGSNQSQLSGSSGTGSATRATSNDLLVFQTSSGGDIMAINSDGTGLRKLTQGIDPVLSPDGQWVAFTRWDNEGERSAVWIINVDGSSERRVSSVAMRKAKGTEWSPDGSRVVVNYQDGGRLEPKRKCIDILDNMEEDANMHLPLNAYDIETTTDSQGRPMLCYKIPPDAYWSLRVFYVANGEYQDVYGGQYAFRPTWDPTNDWRVVADSGYGLIETDVNRDFSSGITDKVQDGSPVFSPDGRYIALVVDENGTQEIHRLNSDGTGRVRLTQTPLWVTTAQSEPAWRNVAPTWSPDGTRIAFLTDRNGRWEVWVMNADGSNQHPMFSEEINDQLQFNYDFNDERVLSWK